VGRRCSSAPRLIASSLTDAATATLSEALADTVTVPETDAPFAGAGPIAAGGVVSGAPLTAVFHVGLDLGLAQGGVVDADLVDAAR